MASIGVAHTDLMAKGGGEAVCMNVLEALQDIHDVTLLTLTEPEVDALNQYFNTTVNPDAVTIARPRVSHRLLGRLEDRLDTQLYNLRNALLNRFVARSGDDIDLIVGTDNELCVAGPLVQYIHTPRFARLVVSRRVGEDSFLEHAYDRLSYRIGGYDARLIRSSRVLTNSSWMADIVQDAYGVRPDVVHPPVDTRGFDGRPWSHRESGFVAIGRLAPDKNVETMIAILDRLRDRGHDVHLHVIGPAYDDAYRRDVRRLVRDRRYVSLEGELPRAALTDVVGRHRFGLHAKRHEHFGMAVAELVAGGAIPFVPDNGGQRDIVSRREALLYTTVDDAVEKIERVLEQPGVQRAIRRDLPDVDRRFGRRRFHRSIRDIVEDGLG